MPVFSKYKLIFIHIPKTAGTSIYHHLDVATNKSEPYKFLPKLDLNRFSREEIIEYNTRGQQHHSYKDLTKLFSDKFLSHFNIFTVVRNPYDRLVSEYYFSKERLGLKDNFESVVKETLSLSSSERMRIFCAHLETQTSFLLNKTGNFNNIHKIFKYENLEECFTYLEGITSLKLRPHFRKADCRKNFESYYSKELKEIVYNFYKEDFINFNYSAGL